MIVKDAIEIGREINNTALKELVDSSIPTPLEQLKKKKIASVTLSELNENSVRILE